MDDSYEKTYTKEIENTRFRKPVKIQTLAKNVEGIISTGNQTGEGWFLTAEMVELINDAMMFEGRTNGRERILKLGLSNEQVARRIIKIYEQILNV